MCCWSAEARCESRVQPAAVIAVRTRVTSAGDTFGAVLLFPLSTTISAITSATTPTRPTPMRTFVLGYARGEELSHVSAVVGDATRRNRIEEHATVGTRPDPRIEQADDTSICPAPDEPPEALPQLEHG